jgi:hypothetical protein
MNDFWMDWENPPVSRMKNLKIWRAYIVHKQQRSPDKSHWHWAIIIPIEKLGRSGLKYIIWYPFSPHSFLNNFVESSVKDSSSAFARSEFKELHPGLVIKAIFGMDDRNEMIHLRNSFVPW